MPLAVRRLNVQYLWWTVPGMALLAGLSTAPAHGVGGPEQYRLPDGVMPDVACWFWTEPEFEPDGYRDFIDLVAAHAPYKLLTTSIRAPLVEVTDREVHDQIVAAARYARRFGIGVVMDLDVRLARQAFRRAHPDELQEMLRIRPVSFAADGPGEVTIESTDLNDHYTGRTTHYIPLSGRLVRVYAAQGQAGDLTPDGLTDVTGRCQVVSATEAQVSVRVPRELLPAGGSVFAMVAFTHLTPDVFAPSLTEFEANILRSYADAPLAGACKDEWGFPPCFDTKPAHNDYWYSEHLAAAYARETDGRDLARDCLLMYGGRAAGDAGRERVRAINVLMRMNWQRNSEIEASYRRTIKEVFGPKALSATHPTWFPYPDVREVHKNGLHWWTAPRDLAQTDELTPFSCRTALSKKWGSSVWVNMYYSPNYQDYVREVWSGALGGGRANYHPPFPREESLLGRTAELLRGGLMRGHCRVRLLNFISKSPLDCPVAVVFGHAAALNWSTPAYGDAGVGVANALWEAGYPADLIPSTEIESGALRIDESGRLRYGAQEYAAAIIYHPEFDPLATAQFMDRLARRGATHAAWVGPWTMGPEGEAFDGAAGLAAIGGSQDVDSAVRQTVSALSAAGVEPQAKAIHEVRWDLPVAVPPMEGPARLLDGTQIVTAAVHEASGDAIRGTVKLGAREVDVEAIGLVAARWGKGGELQALAAGGLKRFAAPGFSLELPEPVDLALWRDGSGHWRGVVQDLQGPIPPALLALTDRWERISLAPPPAPEA